MELKNFDYISGYNKSDFFYESEKIIDEINIKKYIRIDSRFYYKYNEMPNTSTLIVESYVKPTQIECPNCHSWNKSVSNYQSLTQIDNSILAELIYQHLSKVCERFYVKYGKVNLGCQFNPPLIKTIYDNLCRYNKE